MTYEENTHLSMYLNESVKSLPIVKLFQNSIRRYNKNNEIICGVLGKFKQAIVGSMAEGLDDSSSDLDVIIFVPNFKVFDSIEKSLNKDFGHCHTFRQPDERHPGFSKLKVLSLDCRIFEEDIYRYIYKDVKEDEDYIKNNVKELINSSDIPTDFSIHGPACSYIPTNDCENVASEFAPFDISDHKHFDFVFGIRGKQWPAEAAEWKTRRRASNWPTIELKKHIISTGYVLAGVGSKESKESELQWRVSFNEAEQLMIESLNETQIHCLLLLRLLKNICLSDISGKNITSYTMKTVMFWCLEEKSVGYWQPSNLIGCFCFCVSKLKSFVDEGFLPNYFIKKRNQFVAIEFTCEIQTKTKEYLEGFLKDRKAGISLILPSYRENADSLGSQYRCQLNFIRKWLTTQLLTAYLEPLGFGHSLLELYDGYNIQHIYKRCNDTFGKLTTVGYNQPLIKKLQNYMGVLQYLLYREEKDRLDSDTRSKYSEYMELSASGDLTHNTLRMATCYLDDGVKEDCLSIIRRVTDSDGHLYKQTHRLRLQKTLHCDTEALFKKRNTFCEHLLYTTIINDVDLVHQDPYRTTHEFEKLKDKGHVLYGYDTLILAWKECYFDVTFMPAELPVLPKPAALELCIDKDQKHISFHPFLYGLLLEYLWHEKYCSENEKRKSVLEKMENCISDLPDDQQPRGLNFIVYCYLLQKDYRSASRYLFRSFKLNPVKQNVAFLYIKYIVTLLRKAISDVNEDPRLWLQLLGIEWNIDL